VANTSKYSWHAERNCIKKCKRKNVLTGCDMYIVKITDYPFDGPCITCHKIIKKYGIKNIYWRGIKT